MIRVSIFDIYLFIIKKNRSDHILSYYQIGLSDIVMLLLPIHSPSLCYGLFWYQIGLSDPLLALKVRSDTSIAHRATFMIHLYPKTVQQPIGSGLKPKPTFGILRLFEGIEGV